MVLGKMLASTAAGALLLSSGALGRSLAAEGPSGSEVNTSSAECTVVAIGYSEARNQELVAEASAEAAAFICDGVGAEIDIASKTASAFALAVASAGAECILAGDAKAEVKAHADAVARAEIWAASYFEAFADAGNCEKCKAYASSFGYIEKYIFLEAVAKAKFRLKAYTTQTGIRELTLSTVAFSTELQVVFVSAFADALAAAANFKETDGCLAFVNAGGCIWTEGHPDEVNYCAQCTAIAFSAGATDFTDALADVDANVFAYTCGESVAEADLTLHASALASATAKAVSYAFATCTVDEGAFACADASSEIQSWVQAVAKAWAQMWAGATNCEGTCDVNVDSVVEAIGTVLVDAATKAFVALCESGGSWTVADLEAKIRTDSLCAIAEATVVAISQPPYLCLAGGTVIAEADQPKCPALY